MIENAALKIGDLEIVALTDGERDFPADLFLNASEGEIGALLDAAGTDRIHTNFNAFLIRGSDGPTLVDAGLGTRAGAVGGHLGEALSAAGVRPQDITRLIITHMHGDHIGGTLTPEGEAAFPNAEVIINEDEAEFWSSPLNTNGKGAAAEATQPFAAKVLAAYADRLTRISGAARIAPGIDALPLPGHTPGHMGLRLSSGGQQAVIATDIVHSQVLQLADPEIGVGFDIDPDAARAARKRLLSELAADAIPLTGSHILAPHKFGTVTPKGAGYAFTPVS